MKESRPSKECSGGKNISFKTFIRGAGIGNLNLFIRGGSL
jgi:hypothetical protein